MQTKGLRACVARALVSGSLLFCAAAATPVEAGGLGPVGLRNSYAPAVATADDRFSLEVGVGRLEGTARELVYDSTSGRKISELFWDMENTAMFNVKLSLRVLEWLQFRATGAFAISGDANMDDYDWLYGPVDWSHWSNHPDTDLKHAHMLDLGAELRVLNHDGAQVFGLGGFKWSRFNWDAKGGTYIYSESAFRDTSGSFNSGELGISYTQDFATPYIGVGAAVRLGRFSSRGSIKASHVVKATGKDTHHLRDLLFEDEFDHGRFIEAEAELAYNVNDRLAIVGSYLYTNFDEVRGTAKIVDQNTGYVAAGYGPNAAGAELETQMFSLGVRYALP